MNKIKVAYWYADSAEGIDVQEYRGVGDLEVKSGALVIHDEAGHLRMIVAPGDWHSLVVEDEEE